MADEEILAFAEKATHNWYNAGWHRTFEDYYLGSYCLDEPMRSLTTAEYNRLKEMQKELRAKKKAEEDAKEWRYDHTVYYADNSEEEVWINKFGEEKIIMTVGLHGDLKVPHPMRLALAFHLDYQSDNHNMWFQTSYQILQPKHLFPLPFV